MRLDTFYQIRNSPIIYNYLREDSYHYKHLYRNQNHLKVIEELAKERYKLRSVDKIDKIKNNIELLKTFMDVLK